MLQPKVGVREMSASARVHPAGIAARALRRPLRSPEGDGVE